jgi:hypothetical protein
MGKSSTKINIPFSVNRDTIGDFFNPHDPSPMYKRQLHPHMAGYILSAATAHRRYSRIQYKIHCAEQDKELIDPFMQAVHRHFKTLERNKRTDFRQFKKRAFLMLGICIFFLLFFQGILPLILEEDLFRNTNLSNSMAVLSWVILWKPVEQLVCNWMPALNEIRLYNKLSRAYISFGKGDEETTEELDFRTRRIANKN